MRFGDFHLLMYAVWLVPVVTVFCLWAARRERADLEKFSQKELLPGIAPFYDGRRNRLRVFFNMAALLFLVLALGRPQWGFQWKEDRRKGLDIVVAVDTSKSMLATDMRPDRLAFSKAELKDLVKRLKGDRVGLIAFAGQAFLQCPLTGDYSGFLIALNDLNVDTIPKGGTSIPQAIKEAVRSYEGAHTANQILIVITDGENTEGNVPKAVEEAKKADITIYTIGIGTAAGDVIPVRDEKGKMTYLRDKEGNIVRSRLMDDTLKKIAGDTGGMYVKATQLDLGLRRIYSERLEQLEKKKAESRKVKVYKERFQTALAAALVLLVAGLVMEIKREGKSGV